MKYEIEIKPFTVPNFVIPKMPAGKRQDGFNPSEKTSIPITDLHPEALASLCEDFRIAVFEKAGCKDPGNETGPGPRKLYKGE